MKNPRVPARKKKIFLSTLRKNGKVNDATFAAGYSDSSFLYKCRKSDPEFAKAWDEAKEEAMDLLEDEAFRRAHDGVEDPQFYKGEVAGYKTKYSDSLIMFLLRAGRPEKFRENIKIDGELRGKLGIAVLPMTALDDNSWEQKAIGIHEEVEKLPSPKTSDDGSVVRA